MEKIYELLSSNGYTLKGEIIADDTVRRVCVNGEKQSSMSYQLRCEGDNYLGWFHSFKDDEIIKIYPKGADLTPADKEQIRRAKIAHTKARKMEEQDAIKKAVAVWSACDDKGIQDNAYVKRKQITAMGARLYKGMVTIPIYREKQIVALQYIPKEGGKFAKFSKGARLAGGYAKLAANTDNWETLYICEGWATGCTLREVTGCPVIVAFNAGNLQAVAGTMRAAFNKARIIIAGDDDKYGDKNIGVIKGQAAANAIAGEFIAPIFKDESTKPTDFNDLVCLEGKEAVSLCLAGGAPSQEASPPQLLQTDSAIAPRPQPSPDWQERLKFTEKGELIKDDVVNIVEYLLNHEHFEGCFVYDDFVKEPKLVKQPMWLDKQEKLPRIIVDRDLTEIEVQLSRLGLKASPSQVKGLMRVVYEKHKIHPAREYFARLEWDGVKRLDSWLFDYCGAFDDDAEYIAAVGRKWLVAAVARIFEAGCKFDSMLILEGKQNSGKSEIFRQLATIGGETFFDDSLSIKDLGSKDAIGLSQGCLILEIAEMSGIGKRDVNELKQQITIREDRMIRKYENSTSIYPRQYVLAGTINPVGGYLTDSTGNRRFWPVRVADDLKIADLKRDVPQLWAEAVTLYKAGERRWLEGDLYEKAEAAQRKRMVGDVWESEIVSLIESNYLHKYGVGVTAVKDALRIQMDRFDKMTKTRIDNIFAGLGYSYTKRSRRIEGFKSGWVSEEVEPSVGEEVF